MAKKPDQRHSKDKRDPVTIDLDAKDVKRIEEEAPETSSETEAVAEANAALDTEPTEPVATEATKEAEQPGEAVAGETAEGMEAGGADSAAQAAVEEAQVEEDGAAVDKPEETRADETAETAKQPGGFDRPDAEPAPRRSGGAGALAGGVIGAAVTLAVAGGAWYAGVLPQSGKTGAAVEQQASEIASLRSQIEAIKAEAGKAAVPADQPDLSGDLETLRGQIADLTKSLKTVTDEVAVLGSASGGQDNGQAAALAQRLTGIEEQVSALSGKVSDAAGSFDEQAAAALVEQKTAPLAESVQQAQAAANSAQSAVSGLAEKVTGLETNVKSLSDKLAQDSGQADVARAIAATALKSAIDRGQPFMTELETFTSVNGGGDAVDALRTMAASGVPTRATLADEADDAAYAMIEATQALPENAGFLDRLSASARSLVKSRPVGTPEGDRPADIAARMVSAVQSGDYGKALAEYDTLPDAAKAAGKTFAAKLKARMEADRLVDEVLSSSLRAAGQKG